MRLKTALALLALTLCTGIAVLTVSLRSGMSLGFATPYLETRASELLGRRLSFKDAPRIQIKSGLHIAASNVALANADWAGNDDMLQLQSITAQLDLATLFEDQIVLETLLIDGLQLRLRKSIDGLSNLPQIANAESETEATDEQRPLPVVIRHIQVDNVLIDRKNDETGQSVSLIIDSLSQAANSKNSLVYKGNGSLQGRPWNVSIDGSGFDSLRSGRDMSANFSGALGDLRLEGDYRLPNIRELQNLTLNAQLDGPVPDRISALSPLLEPNEPAQIVLRVSDIDPGLRLDLAVKLTQLNLQVNGDIDNPQGSDGLDLAVQLNAASLPRLAQALGLGETTDVPLTLDGRLLRKDKHIELRDAVLVAGDHRVQANIVLPAFPGTDGATVNFSAEGPDFALYQRLFGRSANLEVPYVLIAEVISDVAGGETIKGNLRVGQHRLQISGLLDNFPSYAGSDLTLDFDSPSLQAITANAGIELPADTPISITAAVSVSDDAVVSVNSAEIVAFDFTSVLSGRFDSYPDFGNARLQFRSQGASLATLGQRFGIHSLGDLPLSLSTDIQGSPREIVIRNLRLDTGGLQLQSGAGALRYAKDTITSDLRLSITLTDIDQLLGNYAPAYSPAGTYRFDLLPQLSPALFSIGLENLSGPGVSGAARLELASNFQLNEKTLLTADLNLEDVSQLLPSISGYTPPKERLFLRVVTRPGKEATQIDVQLLDAGGELLAAGISLPADFKQQGISLSVKGAGDDVRKLGTHASLPEQQIPYVVDLSATAQGEDISAEAHKVQLGDNHVYGAVHWEGANKSLTADLQVPSANLQAWLPKGNDADASAEPAATDGRSIPDRVLPLALLHDYRIDLSLETGPLGLLDPKFKTQSLIDESSVRLQSGDGKGQLHIEKIVGSRGLYKADISITDTQAPAHIETDLKVSGMPFGIVAAGTNYDSLPKYDLTAIFDAKGNDLRALAATLHGEFLMTGSPGTLKKMKLSAATESFIAQLFQTLLPMLTSGSTNMEVECSVLAARATDGMLTLDPGFVFRSAQLDLSAEGKVNLRNEKIGVRFTNRARKGLGISAASLINPYVEITGTLSKPTLGLDIASSAITGGAAVATGGITLLAKPLYDRFLQKGNPCDAALTRWKETAN